MATKKNKIEGYFEWWLNELKENGYVKKYSRESFTFDIYKPLKVNKYTKFYKTKKPLLEEVNLLQKLTYTEDYTIEWDMSAYKIFFEFYGDDIVYNAKFLAMKPDGDFVYPISFVDVKPPAKAARFTGSLTSSATFPIIQKILANDMGIYVNKIIPIPMSGSGKGVALFNNTFTPRRYLFSDGMTKVRKQNYKVVMLQEFLKQRLESIEFINQQLEKWKISIF